MPYIFFIFETGSYYVNLTDRELSMQPKLISN